MVAFMSPKKQSNQQMALSSRILKDAYMDFLLSREAMQYTQATLAFYRYTAGRFLLWAERQGITAPEQVTARLVREYLAGLAADGKKDTTLHDHARAIRTLIRFWHAESYIPELVKFDMPRLEEKRLPVLTAEQLQQIVKACNVRDKAIVLFLADSGLRRSEIMNLNWGDVDMMNGLVRVKQGKGKKDRSAVIGTTTRRALLRYRRTVPHDENIALFQSRKGGKLTGSGILLIFRRLSKITGIHVTPHALRRTFTILSLRSGMSVLHLQALLGHADLTMVYHYAQMVDEDLLQAHEKYGPIDNLLT
jgi:site-specific recombinase XerD